MALQAAMPCFSKIPRSSSPAPPSTLSLVEAPSETAGDPSVSLFLPLPLAPMPSLRSTMRIGEVLLPSLSRKESMAEESCLHVDL